jgi:T5SS/PEP-CTERM-associated repeat protein
LFIGYQSSGQFVVANGAQAFSGTSQIGLGVGSVGFAGVNGAGSKWTNSESLYVGVAGSGQLVASNGGTVVVDDLLSIGPHGTVEGNSHIVAEVRNGGTVSPGLSTSFVQTDAFGTLHVDGDFTQTAAGTLQIQLASTNSFDTLAVDGHATLGGTLQASLFGGFSPTVGSAFQVLTATGGITGTFTLDFSTLGTGQGPAWILVYSDSDVILKLVNLPSGDYNGNGVVDAADYVVWQKSVDQTGAGLAADGNSDNVIDDGDYHVWRAQFGQSAGSDSLTSVTVPEPSTLMLLMFAAAGCCRRRFRSPWKVAAAHLTRETIAMMLATRTTGIRTSVQNHGPALPGAKLWATTIWRTWPTASPSYQMIAAMTAATRKLKLAQKAIRPSTPTVRSAIPTSN